MKLILANRNSLYMKLEKNNLNIILTDDSKRFKTSTTRQLEKKTVQRGMYIPYYEYAKDEGNPFIFNQKSRLKVS